MVDANLGNQVLALSQAKAMDNAAVKSGGARIIRHSSFVIRHS
jgi:hypothetical protein